MFPVMRVHSKEKEKEKETGKDGVRILMAWVNENNNSDLTDNVRYRFCRNK